MVLPGTNVGLDAIRSIAGIRKAKVFPVPVRARANTSLPANAAANVFACTSVMVCKPMSSTRARLELGCNSSHSAKDKFVSNVGSCSASL